VAKYSYLALLIVCKDMGDVQLIHRTCDNLSLCPGHMLVKRYWWCNRHQRHL